MTAMSLTEKQAGDNRAADDPGGSILVVGVDGSAPSWDAFAWAAGEAAARQWTDRPRVRDFAH